MNELLLQLIEQRIASHPRSLQKALGPSEIGHPCSRRLGYKLFGTPERESAPAWKATVGTAVHAWLEDMLYDDNTTSPVQPGRWLIEQHVTVGQVGDTDITGSCDLYDLATHTVVDFKTCRCNTRTKCDKRRDPGVQYRVQAHLYGRGWQLRGYAVETVALMFLPRNGELRDAHYWTEPYDETIAVEALQRVNGINTAVNALGENALPILPTSDAYCAFCPYFAARSQDLAAGCPGDPSSAVNTVPDNSAPAFGAVSTEEKK